MTRLQIEIPAWLIELSDDEYLLYELNKIVREACDLIASFERGYVRTDPERVLKRALTKLLLVRAISEVVIAIKKERTRREFEDLKRKIEEMYEEIGKKLSKV